MNYNSIILNYNMENVFENQLYVITGNFPINLIIHHDQFACRKKFAFGESNLKHLRFFNAW